MTTDTHFYTQLSSTDAFGRTQRDKAAQRRVLPFVVPVYRAKNIEIDFDDFELNYPDKPRKDIYKS